MSTQADIDKAAADSKEAAGIMKAFAKGDAETQVDNGLPDGIPSLAKFIAEKDAEFQAALPDMMDEATDRAETAATNAETSASRVDLGALDDAVAATAADVAATGDDVIQVAADKAAVLATKTDVEALAASADFSAQVAQNTKGLYPDTTKALSKGVAALTGLVGGSGGTDGTFALAFSGGAGSNAAGWFVVSGGTVTDAQITYPGYGYTSAPTVSFAASAGLDGAAATAVIAPNTTDDQYFNVPDSDDAAVMQLWQNVSGAATDTGKRTVSSQGVMEATESAAAMKVAEYVQTSPSAYVPGYPDLSVARTELFEDGRVARLTTTDGAQYLIVNGRLSRVRTDIDPNDADVFIPGFTATPINLKLFNDDRVSHVVDDRGRYWNYDGTWTTGGTSTSGNQHFDAVIYGSNPAGLMAAARLKMRGKTVCVLEPYPIFGGMHACGLGFVDRPVDSLGGADSSLCIAGLTRSLYYNGVSTALGTSNEAFKWRSAAFVYEIVAQDILTVYADLSLANVQLDGPRSIRLGVDGISGAKTIEGVFTRAGYISGDVFIDCSYEGDLMAAALGNSGWTYGRESNAETGEEWAGFGPRSTLTGMGSDFALYTGLGSPVALNDIPTDLPVLIPDPLTERGAADNKVQAFNFRLNLTRDSANYVPFEKPAGYDYRYCLPTIEQIAQRMNLSPSDPQYAAPTFCRDSASFGYRQPMTSNGQNYDRYQFNNFDLLNFQFGYATANWSRRSTMLDEHAFMFKSLLYFVANDPVARQYGLAAFQDDINDVTRPGGFSYIGPAGLCADEFQSSKFGVGFPPAVYVREARRLKAQYVMSYFDQAAVADGGTPTKATSIGKWGYNWDMHNAERFRVVADGETLDDRFATEGPWTGQDQITALYQMPAEMMWPAAALKMRNLVVPVCAGLTHIGWSPDRLESAFGLRGEAAGENAAWYIDNAGSGISVSAHPYSDLSARLTQRGSIL